MTHLKSTLLLILLGMTIGTTGAIGKTHQKTAPAATPIVVVTECVDVCSQYRQFSWAIAKAEGFFIKGSIPNRNHNPGDIKTIHAYTFPGQVGVDKHGHVIFRNDNKGWAALQNQVRKMCVDSGRYSPQMSIQQIGRQYAKNWEQWSSNVARNMKCDPKITLAELFDIPPVIHVQTDPKVLEGIL
jgi:hypothetical protein